MANKLHISYAFTFFVVFAIIFPAVHQLGHSLASIVTTSIEHDNRLVNKKESTHIQVDNMDCQVCNFHFQNVDTPSYFDYEIDLPQIAIHYIISYQDSVNLYPSPLFSLRAPPIFS